MTVRLPDKVYSRQDLRAVMLEIHAYAGWMAKTGIKQKLNAGQAGDPPALSVSATEIVAQAAGGQPGQAELEELVKNLEKFEKQAPTIAITLAAAPSGGLKKDLVAWCRQNIDPNILVDFDFNSTMLGGMVVRYGSHMHDWSFRRRIMANLPKFPEALRNA